MARFSPDFIRKVTEANDIVQIISKHTRLSKSGSNYTGLCPFHAEKTPSFSVSQTKQLYYCFGCEKGGDMIGFVMDLYKFSFSEAVEFLASQANIQPEYEEYSEAEENKFRIRKQIYEINREAANFYYVQRRNSRAASEYLDSRGLSRETIKKFGIGYAPKGNQLCSWLRSKGFSDDLISESSLGRRAGQDRMYDYFQNRIIFPILDVSGNIVGFGGRVLDDSKPKYLNSPENAVFFKSSTLFGLSSAVKELKDKPLLLAEGYMDVIGLYDKGIKTACASLGTAFTERHAKIISRYTQKVTICYDGDISGINAAVKASEILTKESFMPKVLLLENGEDPDSYIRKYGADSFREKLAESEFAVDFKLRVLRSRKDMNDIVQRAEYVKAACSEAASLNDPVKWDFYAKKIAFEADTDINVIKDLISSHGHSAEAEPPAEKQGSERTPRYKAQMSLMNFILQGKSSFDYFTDCGGSGWIFDGSDLSELYEILNETLQHEDFLDNYAAFVYNNSVTHIVSKVSMDADAINKSEAKKLILTLKIAQYEKELKSVKRKMETAEKSSAAQDIAVLLQEHSFLMKKLLELKKEAVNE